MLPCNRVSSTYHEMCNNIIYVGISDQDLADVACDHLLLTKAYQGFYPLTSQSLQRAQQNDCEPDTQG